ncbi:MAG: ester cyclase [Chloroflexota bacterium]|nr:ester cyclase [Chloroflexota bacterium]
MSAKDVARASMEAWNKRDFARMRELMHPEYSYTGGDGQEQKGPDAGLAVAHMFADAFPDGRIDIVNIKEAGDTAMVEFVGRGTHKGELMGIAPTGKTLTLPVCNVMEVRDGKIYREREYMDMMTLMTQLGVMPAPAAAHA